jgi:hypothetical protein
VVALIAITTDFWAAAVMLVYTASIGGVIALLPMADSYQTVSDGPTFVLLCSPLMGGVVLMGGDVMSSVRIDERVTLVVNIFMLGLPLILLTEVVMVITAIFDPRFHYCVAAIGWGVTAALLIVEVLIDSSSLHGVATVCWGLATMVLGVGSMFESDIPLDSNILYGVAVICVGLALAAEGIWALNRSNRLLLRVRAWSQRFVSDPHP